MAGNPLLLVHVARLLQQSQDWEAAQSPVVRQTDHGLAASSSVHTGFSRGTFQLTHWDNGNDFVPSIVDTHFPLILLKFSLSDEQLEPTKL